MERASLPSGAPCTPRNNVWSSLDVSVPSVRSTCLNVLLSACLSGHSDAASGNVLQLATGAVAGALLPEAKSWPLTADKLEGRRASARSLTAIAKEFKETVGPRKTTAAAAVADTFPETLPARVSYPVCCSFFFFFAGRNCHVRKGKWLCCARVLAREWWVVEAPRR